MKKVYRFYRLSDIENENNKHWKDYPVYAFTNDKRLAKEFMKTRNMDVMRVVTSKMTNEQYVRYCNTFRSSELSENKYLTCTDFEKKKWRNVKVVTTWYENEKVSEIISDGLGTLFSQMMPPTLIKKELRQPLIDLQYIQQWASYQQVYDGEYEDYIPEIIIDGLMLLLSYFSDTF